ncbi:DUF4038 domain-containing protein [candidate division KSB1 bacterium]|nr:DUF4038 domain-containing protein [candidate division KSB1 bacterium]
MKKSICFIALLLVWIVLFSCKTEEIEKTHINEIKEIVFKLEETYENPYAQMECWVQLKGPQFDEKIYGFWNGENEFVIRIVATHPGEWTWRSFSNPPDPGITNHSGVFTAVEWSEQELQENPNRRGFIRPTENGHALEYADGTPFFMLGDTWWAASTWRYPLKGILPDSNWAPNENISFEQALAFRKKQGFNTIAMIASYPNWDADEFPPQFKNGDTVGVRQAWKKNGLNTAKDMHDEAGNKPFEAWEKAPVIADFHRVNPEYFKSLDRKIQYLNQQGFVPFLETVRRDHGPSWKVYFAWPHSFSRYVQYIIARYGAYNLIFSGIHLDWINKEYCLTAEEFNEALTFHRDEFGRLPYNQPYTTLIDGSTFRRFGHGNEAPWLTMHSVGNTPRNHGFYPMLEELFLLEPPYPAANLEPYYPGWDHDFHNTVAGERPVPNSERDNYFARAQMYGSVLSGGLAGHIYGTGAYCGNTTGEPKNPGDRPYIWEALNYPSGAQMQYLGKFILSEGPVYKNCTPCRENLQPNNAWGAPENGLDGWAFLMLSDKKNVGFLYFENQSTVPQIFDLVPQIQYHLYWYDPISGEWLEGDEIIITDGMGTTEIEHFPDGTTTSCRDWCLKIKI